MSSKEYSRLRSRRFLELRQETSISVPLKRRFMATVPVFFSRHLIFFFLSFLLFSFFFVVPSPASAPPPCSRLSDNCQENRSTSESQVYSNRRQVTGEFLATRLPNRSGNFNDDVTPASPPVIKHDHHRYLSRDGSAKWSIVFLHRSSTTTDLLIRSATNCVHAGRWLPTSRIISLLGGEIISVNFIDWISIRSFVRGSNGMSDY